ncbi:hypothetical protein HY418_02875 [Candidatus Kaiserbacteria bacterium]|nr:hypothetical protein [Candidatus Kaiserbacteria bacterium]
MKRSSVAIGGKAKNLVVLNSIVGISVPAFTVMPAHFSPTECKAAIKTFLHDNPNLTEVAARSSALNEDAEEASFAGMYATKLRVQANSKEILAAIDEVRQSGVRKEKVAGHYSVKRGLRQRDAGMAVIVQKMIHPHISGVIFSHGLHARDGYYLISTTEGLGEAVVSGAINGQLIRVARHVKPTRLPEAWLRELIIAMRLVEKRMGNDIDVEFAYANERLYILQCRPITTVPTGGVSAVTEEALAAQIENIDEHVRARSSGDVLGDMIDINPAELLGSNPTKLDISIFRYLFADSIVERARRDMGYDPLDVGLITEVGGKPYVSLRAAAFSFRPIGIPTSTYQKIVDVYRNMLTRDPSLQSRVEFAVFAMRSGEKLEHLMDAATLSPDEKVLVREAFIHLDDAFTTISKATGASLPEQIAGYEQETRKALSGSLEDMLRHVAAGTELFVRVARLAFYWKNRFEELHPEANLNELLVGHLVSVSSRMQTDLFLCSEGELPREELMKRYGHLRPGQFSVFGESYADDPAHYLFARLQSARDQRVEKRDHQYVGVTEFDNVITFMQAREEVKFLFSESFGDFITALKEVLDAQHIPQSVASQYSWEELWKLLIEGAAPAPTGPTLLPMVLPEVIIPGHNDLSVVVSGTAAPSYITQKVIKARVCVLDAVNSHADVDGAIVVVPNADPGYDYLFHSGAAGIVTKSGGPASHMCIRAVELQTPACIGCGERIYAALSAVDSAILDCQARQIILPE